MFQAVILGSLKIEDCKKDSRDPGLMTIQTNRLNHRFKQTDEISEIDLKFNVIY